VSPDHPGLLVVDDDPFIRRLVVTTLQDVTRFTLTEAADGEEALARAEADPPAVVLLDVDMPRLDGIEVCRRLRARPDTAGATIVILTAAHGEEVQERAEAAGADLFLTKPFSPLQLLRLVDRLGGDGARQGR
jgi:CheY-like chemotaxis protein